MEPSLGTSKICLKNQWHLSIHEPLNGQFDPYSRLLVRCFHRNQWPGQTKRAYASARAWNKLSVPRGIGFHPLVSSDSIVSPATSPMTSPTASFSRYDTGTGGLIKDILSRSPELTGMITSSVLILRYSRDRHILIYPISAEIRPMKKVHRSPYKVSLYRLSVHPRSGNMTRISANQDSPGSPPLFLSNPWGLCKPPASDVLTDNSAPRLIPTSKMNVIFKSANWDTIHETRAPSLQLRAKRCFAAAVLCASTLFLVIPRWRFSARSISQIHSYIDTLGSGKAAHCFGLRQRIVLQSFRNVPSKTC